MTVRSRCSTGWWHRHRARRYPLPRHQGHRVIGSANHDPRPSPTRRLPDPTRRCIQLSFGDGIHHCIGAPLARIVTPIAFTALLELPSLASVDWCNGRPTPTSGHDNFP